MKQTIYTITQNGVKQHTNDFFEFREAVGLLLDEQVEKGILIEEQTENYKNMILNGTSCSINGITFETEEKDLKYDFEDYKVWCKENDLTPHNADNLTKYVNGL